MVAGEAGADYVLFGETDKEGVRPSVEAIAERLNWWAELFEPPCVGYATSPDEAFEFAAAGADFVLVGDGIWSDPRGPAAALEDAGRHREGAGARPEIPAGRAHEALRLVSIVAGCCCRSRRGGADVADAAGATPSESRSSQAKPKPKPRPSRRARQGNRSGADAETRRKAGADGDRTAPAPRIPMPIWSTAPISAASTRPRSIWRPSAPRTTTIPRR